VDSAISGVARGDVEGAVAPLPRKIILMVYDGRSTILKWYFKYLKMHYKY